MTTIKLWEITDDDLWGSGTKHLEYVSFIVHREDVIEYARLKYATPQGLLLTPEASGLNHNRAIGVQPFIMNYNETTFATVNAEVPKLRKVAELQAEIKTIQES
jgi:hypothetical protein